MKIFIELKENKLNFSIRRRLNTEQKNLLNTNVISQNELIFSNDYICSNLKIVSSFIKELVKSNNINIITIREYEIAPLILSIIKNISEINTIYFLQETALTFKLCETIIKNKHIKYISVYNLQTFMLEMFDNENIYVDSRNEILFSSKFMILNNLDKFSSLYYKKELTLDFPFSELDEEDFVAFCKINKYLKNITINVVKIDNIEFILKVLKKCNKKNIKIIINENVKDLELIDYLRKLNKAYEKDKIKFKINYSDDYLKNNLIDQINLNAIKSIILLIIVIIFLIVGYVFISNYNSMQKVEDIQAEIDKVMEQSKNEETKDKVNSKVEIGNSQITIDDSNNSQQNLTVINKDLEALKELNADTVGWLKVKNTNVDYPVVQAEDNDYYLNKNFNKEHDVSGWIFMNYLNDPKVLSQNTIIFGHNMFYSGVMFGTLYKTKHADWYTNTDNQIIEFNTLYENIKWKIFSIYVVPVTNDYLISNFSTDEKYMNFLKMITDRSIYNFGVPLLPEDKILTLSTCSNNGKNRLVIHAVRLD